MDFLEWLYYESLPFAYAGLAAFAFAHHDSSKIAAVAAVVLVICSFTILQKRFQYRTFQSQYKNNIRL